jgi:hypothetical protein
METLNGQEKEPSGGSRTPSSGASEEARAKQVVAVRIVKRPRALDRNHPRVGADAVRYRIGVEHLRQRQKKRPVLDGSIYHTPG